MNQPAISLPSSSSSPVRAPRLLLVDDDRIMRMAVQAAMLRQGYEVLQAGGGEEALAMLQRDHARIDAVVLDRQMPGMDGIEVVERMKSERQFASIPIIMLTGSGSQEQIQEGIDAGVFYYLVKPIDESLLQSVVNSALREKKQKLALISELNRYSSALHAMRNCEISVRTLNEAEDTACFLASCFPDPERVVSGLMELLTNAVEHGNLGISYEEKHQLLSENRWHEELNHRAHLPEYEQRAATVIYQHKEEGYLVRITDSGPGFDWKRYWNISAARATASHGRGIARARLLAFDRMGYNESGNSVTVMVAPHSASTEGYAW